MDVEELQNMLPNEVKKVAAKKPSPVKVEEPQQEEKPKRKFFRIEARVELAVEKIYDTNIVNDAQLYNSALKYAVDILKRKFDSNPNEFIVLNESIIEVDG